jgi:hypothetical protein
LPGYSQLTASSSASRSGAWGTCPQQPGYNKRLQALAPQISRAINYLAYISPSIFEGLCLFWDSTSVPCGASRETVKRSEFAGIAAYGYCRSHSRFVRATKDSDLLVPNGPDADGAVLRFRQERLQLTGNDCYSIFVVPLHPWLGAPPRGSRIFPPETPKQ